MLSLGDPLQSSTGRNSSPQSPAFQENSKVWEKATQTKAGGSNLLTVAMTWSKLLEGSFSQKASIF